MHRSQLVLAAVAIVTSAAGACFAASGSPFDVDPRRLVARADLRYDTTFDISDHGLPVGNGRVGSLVWTSPHALKFQVNRVDVYANGCETESFTRRDHDYAHACGLLDIELVGRLLVEEFRAPDQRRRRRRRDRAKPHVLPVSPVYRNFPGLTKDAGGVYHIAPVNNGEGVCGRDTFEAIGMIRCLLPTAIRAAEILDADAKLRGKWRELLERIATIPTSDEGHAALREGYAGPPVWVSARPPVVRNEIRAGFGGLSGRLWELDPYNVETRHAAPATWKLAMDTYRYTNPRGVPADKAVHVLSQLPVVAAKLGQADDFRNASVNILRCDDAENDFCFYEETWRTGVLANRMTLREGVNAIDAQRLGTVTYAVHEALCQSNPGTPGGEVVLNLFPAWPKDWNARFTQAARGQFLVGGSWSDGRAELVEITSQSGNRCRLRNPWPAGGPVTIYRDGEKWKSAEGDLLEFETQAGSRYLILPGQATPQSVRHAVP